MATDSMKRSLKLIKEYKWQYWITEHWNSFARKRQDLFGFIDILCLDGKRTIGVQGCGGGDYQEHVRDIIENEYVIPWLLAGNECKIFSWRRYLKKRGGKAKEWRVCIADVLLVKGGIYIEETWKK